MYIACFYVCLHVHVWVHMYICSRAYRGQRTTLDAMPKVPTQIELWDRVSHWLADQQVSGIMLSPPTQLQGYKYRITMLALSIPPLFFKHEFWGSNSNDCKAQIWLQAALGLSCPCPIHLGALDPEVIIGLICRYFPHLCDQKLQESVCPETIASKSKSSSDILFTGKFVFP